MSRNVIYEIPSLRKQINRLEAVEKEFLKKSKDFIKQSNIIKSDYYISAKKLGIEVKSICFLLYNQCNHANSLIHFKG